MSDLVRYEAAGQVTTVTLDSPARRNALSSALLVQLREALAGALDDYLVLIVAVEHGHGFLHDDRAVVEFLVDEVDGASGNLHAVGEGLLLRFEAGKCG